MLKLIILKHHPQTYLLGKVQEMEEEPSILLEDCFQVDRDSELLPYPLHTDQRYVFLNTTDVMSILDPTQVIVKKYKKLVNE